MSDLATFLAQALPWPTAAMPGFVNVHAPFRRPGTAKPVWPGHAFTDFNNAVRNAAWRVRNNNDVYVCMSLQADAGAPKLNRRNRRAMRSAAKAVALKAFWLDIDVRNGFVDEQDVLTQFGAFRRAVGLPVPSFVVWSGGGFHVYWVLVDVILPAEWHEVASALAEACRQHGFNADHQCTINPAQLMRLPGTQNHKYDPPRDAKIIHTEALITLDQLTTPLTPYKSVYRAPVSRASTVQRLSLPPGSRPSAAFGGAVLPGRLDDGLEGDWHPTADELGVSCPWWRETLANQGRTAREPEWYEALKVAYHTADGPIAAHRASMGHPGYSVGDTDDKYAQASSSAEAYGWPQCHGIRASGATQCASCPNLVHGKSPLNFARPSPASPAPAQPAPAQASQVLPPQILTPGPIPGTSQIGPTIPFIPQGYRLSAQGLIEHEVKIDRQPQWEVMYPVRVNGFVRQEVNEEVKFGREMLYFQFEDAKKVRPAQIGMDAVHDLRRFKDVLSKQGMSFKDNEAQHLGRFMVSFVQQLRNAQHLSVECEPYGWSIKGGTEDAFTFDGTRFNCSGNRQVAPPDIGLGEKFKSTGSLDIWKAACRLITDQQRPDLNAIIACGLAAPLVQMTGHNGFVVAAYSTATGVQKSAAMRVGQAMWGNPVSGMGGLDDTNNFLNTRLGMLRHLPLFVDELKFSDEFRRAETMVLGITQGKTKGRLNRASETMDTVTFNTLMVTASNASLVEHISAHKTTTAGMARIFEFPVERGTGRGMVDTGKAQSLIGKLEYNFGSAGRIYAEFLGQNVPRVRADVEAMMATISDIVKATTDERFWVAATAVLIVGAKYGNELQLTDIDINQMSLFLLEQFKRQRGQSEGSSANIGVASNIERFVIDFVNAHPQQVLKTDTANTLPGRGGIKPVVLNDGLQIMGMTRGICIHAIRDLKLVRISLADFSKWLIKERRVSKGQVMSSILSMLPAREMKVSLGRGTIYKRAPEAVLEFDVAKMPSLDLF